MHDNGQALIFGKYKQSSRLFRLFWFSLENDTWVPCWSQLAAGQPQEAPLLEGCGLGRWSRGGWQGSSGPEEVSVGPGSLCRPLESAWEAGAGGEGLREACSC